MYRPLVPTPIDTSKLIVSGRVRFKWNSNFILMFLKVKVTRMFKRVLKYFLNENRKSIRNN